jgi:hypothetical protein
MELAGIAVNIRNEHPKGFPLEKKQTNIPRMMILVSISTTKSHAPHAAGYEKKKSDAADKNKCI